jgi:16S rRNA (cytosine1402-N4)-methyltransferase
MHLPVLFNEVIAGLGLTPGQNALDGTVGGGGHTAGLLEATAPDGIVIGFDRDSEALNAAGEQLRKRFGDRFLPIHDSYAAVGEYGAEIAGRPIHGIVLDLGLSSLQLEAENRGFSFRNPDAPLDMRFDQTAGQTAADLLNERSVDELVRIFRDYGEVRPARRLADRIMAARADHPFRTVGDLLTVCEAVLGPKRGKTHPATTVFQALRIATNDELAQLEAFLPQAVALLQPGGRLAIITFHSLEDRLVKQFFREAAKHCICPPELPECRCEQSASLRPITKKPIVPSDEEVARNPRARSAKLRIAEKI